MEGVVQLSVGREISSGKKKDAGGKGAWFVWQVHEFGRREWKDGRKIILQGCRPVRSIAGSNKELNFEFHAIRLDPPEILPEFVNFLSSNQGLSGILHYFRTGRIDVVFASAIDPVVPDKLLMVPDGGNPGEKKRSP